MAGNSAEHKPGTQDRIIVSIIFLLLMGLGLFISAGTASWPAAWTNLVLAALIQIRNAFDLIPARLICVGNGLVYGEM